MDLQQFINQMSNNWKQERSRTQMTLGKIISELESLPQEKLIEQIADAHSYRGYYEDLAFERTGGTETVSELLSTCKVCLGEVFEGYKGGDFQMDESTPLWISHYGSCGVKITGIIEGDVLTFSTEEDD